MANRRDGWSMEYLRYLLRMGRKYPVDFLKHVVKWNVYTFAPGLTRKAAPSRVLRCSEVDAAVAAFRRDGFVVLSDALDLDDAMALHRLVKDKADDIISRFEQGLIPPETLHGPGRFSYGEYGHNPEWQYLGLNERILPILRGIWSGRSFRAVAAGGDFVLPGGVWQPLHTDMAWHGAGENPPRLLVANYYVSDVLPTSGPIRMVPGTARFPVPPHRVIGKREPVWMKESIATGKPGYAVIRDPRGWHGGTPNTSDEPRYMPAVEFVMDGAPHDEIESTAALHQIDRGECIAAFSNA